MTVKTIIQSNSSIIVLTGKFFVNSPRIIWKKCFTGYTFAIICEDDDMLDIGFIIPEYINVGIVVIINVIMRLATCVFENEETNIPTEVALHI